jgi:glycosyltransferase involved in cell wall biosynthesis
MRILKTVQAYYPFQKMGGSVVKSHAIASGLARRGYSVTVLTADLGLARDGLAAAAHIQPCTWGWCLRRDGVETIFFSTFARYRSLTFNPGLFRFCSQSLSSFDLLHVYGLYDLLGCAAGLRCHGLGIPYVVEPMGMFRPIMRNIAIKRLYHNVFDHNFIARARFLIATCSQEKSEFMDAGIPESRIVVRRNGIDLPASLPPRGSFRRARGISETRPVILFLGRVISKKSPDVLIDAFASWRSLRNQFPRDEAPLLIIAGPEEGDGFLARLQARASSLGLGDSVLFAGPLYDDDKWAAYHDADLFVLPSWHENFGNTAAEAMACSTPVIVTDRCGIAPFIVDRAGLVIPHGAEPLVSALSALLDHPGALDPFREQCPAVAAGLSWQEPLDAMELLYSQILAERAPR